MESVTEDTALFMLRYAATALLIALGSMDCFTTVVGTLFFGTQELNPIIAPLVNTNLPAFVVVKLAATVSVGIIFILAERMLVQNGGKKDPSYKTAHNILRGVYVMMSAFLSVVVLNNILVLLQVI